MTEQQTDPSVIEAEQAIVRKCMELDALAEIKFIDAGWDSRIYSVDNDTYIFKFPRSEKVQGRYASQIAALKLAGASQEGVLIPTVRWVDDDYRYFGYEGIKGDSLRRLAPQLDADTKQAIGAKLGEFLKVLHGLELVGVRNLDPAEEIKQIQNWYEKGRSDSQAYFSTDEQSKLVDLVYDIWPKRIVELGVCLTLCHGDFHFDNILYTTSGQVGIIDFGDICVADHSRDFADFEDDIIFEHAIRAYSSDDPKLVEKIRLREDMLKVITLTAQLAKGQLEDARVTVAHIKSYL